MTLDRAVRGVLVAVAAFLVAACGGSSQHAAGPPAAGSPAAARAALQAAGWTVTGAPGMTPISGGRQLAWFEVRGPGCPRISLQFLEDAAHAHSELAAVRKGAAGSPANPGFKGVTIGGVLAFGSPNGARAIPDRCVIALRKLVS